MKILSIILLVGCIIGALLISSDLKTFIDIPSLLVVFIPVVASIPARHGLEGFKMLSKEGEERKDVLHSMGATAIISGVLGTHIGVVIMLGNLGDSSSLGPAIGISLLSTFYGLFIFLLTTVLSHLHIGKEL